MLFGQLLKLVDEDGEARAQLLECLVEALELHSVLVELLDLDVLLLQLALQLILLFLADVESQADLVVGIALAIIVVLLICCTGWIRLVESAEHIMF